MQLLRRTREAEALPRDLTQHVIDVQYECDNHIHMAQRVGPEQGQSWGEWAESLSSMLAESVQRCSDLRHQGHGRRHAQHHVQAAFASAMQQLQTRDYWQEWVDICRKMDHHELWGGKPPADLVFQPNPDNPSEHLLFVKHPVTGVPTIYRTDNILDLPAPDPKKYAKGKYNWYRKGK